jgi:hypothetical protein
MHLAMTHAAIHDAVQAIERRYRPYGVSIRGASGSSSAASARAAHDVLAALIPAQAAVLASTYHAYLASHGLAENDAGVAVGQQAAAGILALRAADGRFPSRPPPPFLGSSTTGKWRPTPSYLPGPPATMAPGAIPWFARVAPFTLAIGAQFRAGPAPALGSARYARDYDEVNALGARFNSSRTPAQTELANFHTDSPLSIWNRTMRGIAAAQGLGIADSARLFALANLATADSLITVWDTKYHHVSWRPITAIREGESDGSSRTAGDPAWEPFLNTPNYPEHSSGQNSISGAMTRSLSLFFGTDHMHFAMTSASPLAVPDTRVYERFSDAARDVVDVRVYHGVHFRFADVAGRAQGRDVAQWAHKHFLRPVRHEDDNDDESDDGEDED